MGASNSRPRVPVSSKFTEGGENVRVKYAASSTQGWRPYMEDARAVVPDLDHLTSFFGVYDGHGGAEVALLCARQFHTELRNHPDYEDDLINAMQSVFSRMDEQLLLSDEWKELINPRGDSDWIQFLRTGVCVCANHWPFTQATPYIAPQGTGSTACVAAIRDNQIIIGNVGDSRCVLSRIGQATELSTDHKPNHPVEKQRIQRAGGRVTRDKVTVLERGRFREHQLSTHRINGMLAVSRVIGDFAFKQNKDLASAEQLAICVPELRIVEISNEIEFLVIGSDGIWDCMTSQAVVDFVHQHIRSGATDLRAICERLVDRCLSSKDNVTVILVQFKNTDSDRLPALIEPDIKGEESEQSEDDGGDNKKTPQESLVEEEADHEDDEEQALLRAEKAEE